MKKLFLSILAVATLASCTKDESFYTEQDSEIKISPVTAMSVKAYDPVYGSIDGTTYPVSENFDVRAYWANEPAGSKFTSGETIYLGTQAEAVPFTNKGMYWELADGTTAWYPVAGFRFYSSGVLGNVGYSGYCWSASPDPSTSSNACHLYFDHDGLVTPEDNFHRGFGISVRCVRE